jgi:predicted DNA-binding protein YlxM (UPF0122 family)
MGSVKNYLSTEELLLKLKEQDWGTIIKRLEAYSIIKIKKHSFEFTYDTIQEAIDIAHEAIRLLWTEERKWDINYYPDVYYFLKGVVDSLVSNYFKKLTKYKKIEINENIGDSTFDNTEVKYDAEQIKKIIGNSFKDDSLAGIIFDCISEGYKPKEISEELDIDINDVYNAIKRVNRKIDEVKKILRD